MSLQRSATRRAGPGPAREKKDYSVAEQGMKELYPLDKNNIAPEIDIVLVPGLGAHPEESWKSETTKFNWATEALVKDFPKSRVLLYRYQSAWTGALKVKQFMGNIAMTLLVCLQSVRKKCQRRPIVFIGHSMGGLVIAKAVTIADSRRDKFPVMFEAIAAAVFFGTPFGGAPVASVAAMYAHVAEKVGQATSSKLLDLMKEGDEGLRELKNEFMRLAGKINPKIELLCFYEEQPTDFSKMAGLPALYGLAKLVIPKQYQEFVSRDSATLPSIDEFGLACNHRDLVKFDGHKDPRWAQVVRDHLKKIIHGAQLAVKNRLNSVRDIDRTMITSIMEALEGAQVQKKRNLLRQNFTPSSWITTEPEYTEWLGEDQRDQKDAEAEHEQGRKGDCLWVRGPEGRGKTSASMAAVEKIETLIRHIEERDTGQDPILLAYFFCDTTQDYNTAEDVLKSIVRQLIRQQETLAPYAKQFMKKKGNEGGKSQAQVTVENLWQTLQDMLTDEFIGRKVIFVLNNVHCLPEDADSTVKLMKFLNAEMQNMNAEETKSRVATRWFITSREAHNVQQALKMDGVRLVDLEDDKYGNQVRDALRSHARQKILTLEQSKNYNKALAYFASSLIGRRAQNTQWIDITCMQLEELPQTNSDLPVRRALETMPQDLKSLLNRSWSQVFRSNEQATEKIKEMLRALVLTYEDPTEDELGILAGLCSNEEEKAELHELIDRCRPLLTIKRDEKVSFMNIVVKTHLLENAKELLGLSTEEIKWQHGVLSLRSFAHLKERYGNEPEPEPTTEQPAEPNDANGTQGEEAADETASHVGQDTDEVDPENPAWTDANDDEISQDGSEAVGGYDDDLSDWDSDDDDEFDEAAETSDSPLKALPYMIKNWLRHASKATLEIAEDLSLEVDFWKLDSHLRRCWLDDYCKVTNTFEYFDHTTLTGLHVAASVGFQQLVAALIRNSEPAKSEITVRDAMVNAPLHFAAHFGRPNIVKELLDRGAPIDDGIEIGEQTPLHMAAFGGHVEVMKKLLLRGANPNAASNDIGPVVNAAISSGNRAAVELLVNHGVSLTLDREDIISPLALSALLSDVSMFEYLIQQYADKLPAVEYSKALVKAAEAGRIEVFNKLLEFHHAPEYFQSALEAAVEDYNWDITTAILERQPGLDCNNLFYTVATCSEPQDNMLEAAWAYGGSISPETLGRSLYDATDREKDNTVKLLLEKCGANPNATGEEYGNALTAAAYDGTLHIVEMLLEAGADVNAPEGYALQAAAAEGHYDVVEELIKRGANVNALAASDNFEAGTALQGATEAGQTEIVRLLLDAGADPNHGAGEDAPPIVAAARRCEEDILKLLLAKKPKLDVFGGPDKSTPLINAAAYMPISSLELLLDAGADINLPDNDGDTALIVASGRGDEEVVAFLLGHGADIMHTSFRGENALQSALKEENTDCLRVLIDHASLLFNAIKKSMDSGNQVVTGIIRSAANNKQGLNYGDVQRENANGLSNGLSNGETHFPSNSLNYDDGHQATAPQVSGDKPRELGADGQLHPIDRQGYGGQDLHHTDPAPIMSHTSRSVSIAHQENDYQMNGADGDSYDDRGYRRISFLESASTDQDADEAEQFTANLVDAALSSVFPIMNGNAESPEEAPAAYHDIHPDNQDGYESDSTEGPPGGLNGSVDDAQSEAPTFGKVGVEDEEDDVEAMRTGNETNGVQHFDESDEPDSHQDSLGMMANALGDFSNELQAALGNQISLLQRFDGSEEGGATAEAHGSHGSSSEIREQVLSLSQQESPVAGLSQLPSAPVELPTQGFIKRKPAPRNSYDSTPRMSQDLPRGQGDAGYQAPSARNEYAPYRPNRVDTGYSGQATASSSQTQPRQASPPTTAAYQGGGYGHSYQSSQSSQTANPGVIGYPPQQQQQQQQQQYQAPGPYDGSEYGNPGSQGTQHPARPQTYIPYNPDVFQQQHQQSNVYTPEQLQAYHNHSAYDDGKYQSYYASLQTAQQQQERQSMISRQESWGAESPPPLKQRSSSFFTGGVKTTFGKAKIVGNGFLNRK